MGTGELLERKYRLRFWAVIGAIALLGMPVGYMLGRLAADQDYDVGAAIAAHPDTAVVLLALYLFAMTVGSWLFRRVADEVEVAHNLAGSAAGFTIYVILFPSWAVLHAAGYAPEPDDWAICAITALGAIAVYAWHKCRAR